jgi:hypothetical protein
VTTLLRDREGAGAPESPSADGEQPVVPPYACEACGAGMQAGQDWCLDCGTAAPGRLGARPGWRAAFTVVGLTLLLLVGAVAASYAALSGDAEREAAKPSSGSGNPLTAQTPGIGQPVAPVTPGATGPGTTAPPPAVVTPPPAVAGKAPATGGTTSSTSTSTATGSSNSSNTSSSSSSNTSGTSSDTIKISRASLYDPDKRAGAEFGPASNAIDSSTSSVWDVTVPADDEPLGVGLVIDLGGLYKLKSLQISTPTSGFDLELYAAKKKTPPPDILDTRWDHLTDRVNYDDDKSVKLTGRADGKVRLIALWFAEATDAKDPRVAIGNVTVRGTK